MLKQQPLTPRPPENRQLLREFTSITTILVLTLRKREQRIATASEAFLEMWLMKIVLPMSGVACLVLSMLTGCGSSVLSLFPNFIAQKKNMHDVAIMIDFVIIEGLMGDTSKVDLVENMSLGNAVLQLCAESLSLKAYPVGKTILSSIGLIMNPKESYKIVRSEDQQHVSSEGLLTGTAPFYVQESFMNDTARERLMNVYTSLINIPSRQKNVTAVIPEAVILGHSMGSTTLMIMLVGGYNVPVSKGVGQLTVTNNRTEGMVAAQRISQLSVMFYIVNCIDGEVIWQDRKYTHGGVIHKEKVLKMARDVLDELP